MHSEYYSVAMISPKTIKNHKSKKKLRGKARQDSTDDIVDARTTAVVCFMHTYPVLKPVFLLDLLIFFLILFTYSCKTHAFFATIHVLETCYLNETS